MTDFNLKDLWGNPFFVLACCLILTYFVVRWITHPANREPVQTPRPREQPEVIWEVAAFLLRYPKRKHFVLYSKKSQIDSLVHCLSLLDVNRKWAGSPKLDIVYRAKQSAATGWTSYHQNQAISCLSVVSEEYGIQIAARLRHLDAVAFVWTPTLIYLSQSIRIPRDSSALP